VDAITRILAAAVALFATAALAAGCGGGKDQEKPSGPTQQELKQSFIVRADRTCADFRRRAAALAAIGTGPKAVARRISRTRRLSAQTLDELEA
jgi:hypothetical protein